MLCRAAQFERIARDGDVGAVDAVAAAMREVGKIEAPRPETVPLPLKLIGASSFPSAVRPEPALRQNAWNANVRCFRGPERTPCYSVSWADDLNDEVETDYVSPWVVYEELRNV